VISDIIESAMSTKGNRRRWAVNTVGGLIVATACEQIVIHGITWSAVALSAVGVIPISLSFFEK